MIDTRFIAEESDEKEAKPQKETFYSGTTLENLRTCLMEDSSGKLYFEKKRDQRHQEPYVVYCIEEFPVAGEYSLRRSKEFNDTEEQSVILEGKLNPQDVMFNKLLGGKSFPVERVWVLKKDSPRNFGDKAEKINDLQDYFEPRNPLDLV